MEPTCTIFVGNLPADLPEPDFDKVFANERGFVSSRMRTARGDRRLCGFVEFSSIEDCKAAFAKFQDHKFEGRLVTLEYARDRATPAPAPPPPRDRDRDRDRSARGRSPHERPRGRDTHERPRRDTSPHQRPRRSWSPVRRSPPRHSPPRRSPPRRLSPRRSPPRRLSPARAPPVPRTAAIPIGPTPPDATATLKVDNVPTDASEREVAHIFRAQPGFFSIRLIRQGTGLMLCFVEFTSPDTAWGALSAIDGYRFDLKGAVRLTVSFARRGNRR